ncbi:MAG: hypothetical protein GJ676_05110 [Rhodobacteraceae bacterium]|nr:hypothetical protein [Paracoccaceae bacterium]
MDPELFIPLIALTAAGAAGFAFGNTGRGRSVLLGASACVLASYILVFHSQLLGWEGMGPGMIAIAVLLPVGFGLVIGAFVGWWRRG